MSLSLPTSTPESSSEQAVICVFCGASPGTTKAHFEAAVELGKMLAKHNVRLVYGGGTTGMMGAVARTLVSRNGPDSVLGVIPRPLVQYERAPDPKDGLTETSTNKALKNGGLGDYGRTVVVEDMHTRKQIMAQEVMQGGPGSGFIVSNPNVICWSPRADYAQALSGGWGTMEELMEVVTWNQLGIHDRGVVALSVEGFFDGIIEWVKTATNAGFIKGDNAKILVEAKSAEEAVKALQEYRVSGGRFNLNWARL